MDSNAPVRRYSREEMRRILELASESAPEGAGVVDEAGFTLAEIQHIAQEVGIDPGRVERASATVRRETGVQARVSFGTYQVETRFGRPLSVEDMRFSAQEADRFFGVKGTLRQSSGLVEWHSSDVGAFVGIVKEVSDTRARVIVDRSSQFFSGCVLLSIGGLIALANVSAATAGTVGVLATAGVAAATAGAVAGFWRWRRNRLLRHMEHLLELMTAGLSS